jgi:NAD(P)H-flavin reductase
MFFISSQYESNMGTNHRGGPQGFVRVEQNDTSGTVIIYPELSGNRLYQTLGNLYTNPRAGLVFPDFESGDALYVTGTTEIVIGKHAAAVLPRSNVVVKIHVVAARLVQRSLAFRGIMGEMSPYNPPVRYLTTERAQALPDVQAKNSKVTYANLLARDLLTPTIARFRFGVSDPEAAGRWKPGQYVALAFEDELSLGYSHMRDDDPKSLNDDYVRTFTVSSASGGSPSPGGQLPDDEFEITIRNVGVVTNFMFRQNIRAGLEVPLKGFGGTFTIEQGPDEIVPFVAGGIGITPLLAHLSSLDLGRIRLFWTINIRDINMVFDTFSRYPSLAQSTRIFVSRINEPSPAESEETIKKLDLAGAHINLRHMLASDVEGHQDLASTWYLCAGAPLRKSLLTWLSGRKVLYEDFNY